MNNETWTEEALRSAQAEIRDTQRERMDEIHALCHDYKRNVMRKDLGAEITEKEQNIMIDRIHEISHLFMWDFDRAVIIHERLAEIRGDDPKELSRALRPVRTKQP